jgi:hypothetical protein
MTSGSFVLLGSRHLKEIFAFIIFLDWVRQCGTGILRYFPLTSDSMAEIFSRIVLMIALIRGLCYTESRKWRI